jgi:hypothetical protein
MRAGSAGDSRAIQFLKDNIFLEQCCAPGFLAL